MKKLFLFVATAMFTGAVNAQGLKGFLNKAKEQVEKVSKTIDKVDKVQKSVNEAFSSTQGEEVRQGESSQPASASGSQPRTVSRSATSKDEVREINGISAIMKDFETEDPRDVTPYKEKYATFKKTANTRIITVDNLSGIILGYYSENRVFVNVPTDGLFCLDEKGNTVKKWPRNEAARLYNINFGIVAPLFNSGRIMIDYRNESSTDAVICDNNLKEIKRFPNVERMSQFTDGVACYIYSNAGRYGLQRHTVFVDANGNQVLKSISDKWDKANMHFDPKLLRPESEGLIAYCEPDAEGKKAIWGFRDAKGNIAIPAKYDMVRDFCNGLAAVATGDIISAKWGFIDKQGNMVIPQKFSNEPSSFDECGLAMVLDKDKKPTFIDKQGNIEPKRYEGITPFHGGVALWQTSTDPSIVRLVDSKFNTIKVLDSRLIRYINSENLYEDIYFSDYISDRMGKVRPFGDYFYFNFTGIMGAEYGGMTNADLGYGLLDRNGNIVIAGVTGCFVDGLAPVNNDHTNEIGYVNMKGEWVIKFERSEF